MESGSACEVFSALSCWLPPSHCCCSAQVPSDWGQELHSCFSAATPVVGKLPMLTKWFFWQGILPEANKQKLQMPPESKTAKHMAPGEADQAARSSPGTTACRCAILSVFLLLEKTVRTSWSQLPNWCQLLPKFFCTDWARCFPLKIFIVLQK